MLVGERYARVERSAVLPELDVALVARCIDQAASQSDAVRTFLAALRGA